MRSPRRLLPIVFSTAIVSAVFALTFGFSIYTPPSSRAVDDEERGSMNAEERYEDLEGRWRFEFDQLKDPRTGTIPRGIRERELLMAQRLPKREQLASGVLNLNTYTALGPNNLGGRTRAIAYDRLDASIILAGGVSSGIFRTTNGGTSWTNVTPSGHIHSVTTIAQDRRTGFTSTWYYGTGEASGNSASQGAAFFLGFGIFKSVDNGVTWTKLAATAAGTLEGFDSQFDIVHKIVVDSTSGNVYAAGQRVIMRSTNGGTSWTTVLGEFGGSTANSEDIVVTTGGRFYASFDGGAGTNSAGGLPPSTAMDGVWTSTTGASGSWTKIAGTGSATTPAGWNAAATYGRVVMALAPSNQDVLYILYYRNFSSNCAGTAAPEADFFKWTQSTTTGVDRSANLPDETGCSNGNDPFAVQGGYDLVVAVKPDDENFVVIGGTNAYRSTDGFATTGATTRIGGYAGTGGYAKYTNHHPDIHALVFHPTTSTTLLCGDDGGVQRTTGVTATPVVWTSLNNDYVTYQYYYVALDPTSGSLNAIGGTQDNGTTYTTGTSSHSEIFSGDGVSVGISSANTYHYVGFQNGGIYRRLSGDPSGFGTDIKPTGSGSGVFVTYFHLNPDNTGHLYYANFANLYRTTSASTVAPGTWTLMTGVGSTLTGNISVLATSRGTYTASHKLYIGSADGKIYRLNDPASAAAGTVPVTITGGSMPAGANVSGIAVDPSDDKLVMVTFSNYGVTSIWYTSDASVASPSWTAVEGTLSLPSIRSCVIVNKLGDPTEYYVGTSVGLYSTTALSGGTTSWVQEGSTSIKYAVTRTLALRPIDNRLLLGTHGNGMFHTTISAPLPIQLASFTGHVQGNGSVLLAWRTISELNNYGFFVERRREGEATFSELLNTFIPGHGTTNEPQNYSYIDATVSYGNWQYRLRQVDLDGAIHYIEPISVSVPTGVDGNSLPAAYQLFQNHPNPFNPSTTIRFSLAQPGWTVLKIFDVLGKEVATLVNEMKPGGQHSVEWAPVNLSSGLYYYRLEAGDFVAMKKLLMLK